MDANGRQINVKMIDGLLGGEKPGYFRNPGIRKLPLDPLGEDKVGGFPGGRCLRSEGSHPLMVFGWPERGIRYGDTKNLWVAESHDCDTLVTWNTAHYLTGIALQVITPTEYCSGKECT